MSVKEGSSLVTVPEIPVYKVGMTANSTPITKIELVLWKSMKWSDFFPQWKNLCAAITDYAMAGKGHILQGAEMFTPGSVYRKITHSTNDSYLKQCGEEVLIK